MLFMITDRLIKLRENRQLKQTEVAKLLNIGTVTYNRYEKGEREPDHNMLVRLATFFNVSVDYLLGINDIPNIAEKCSTEKNNSNQLTTDEQELIHLYRELPTEGKITIKSLTKIQHYLYVKPKSNEKAI